MVVILTYLSLTRALPTAETDRDRLRMANTNTTTMARSFLQVAATEEVASPLRVVQIEGLVILKIIKHCKEFSPALVTGQLLGLDVGSVLELTNCFPFPVTTKSLPNSRLIDLFNFFWFLIFFFLFFLIHKKIREEDEENEAEGANYQLDMMKCLREVNVDNNTVGWYLFSFSLLLTLLYCYYFCILLFDMIKNKSTLNLRH